MIKNIKILFFFVFSYLMHADGLSSQKEFPSYPEVWGYDISEFPAVQSARSGIDAYRMPDGDIWFLIGYSLKYKDPMRGSLGGYLDKKYVLLKFFKGEQFEINDTQRKDLHNVLEGKELPKLFVVVNFSDGSTLKNHYTWWSPKCFEPRFIISYYIKRDANENEKKYSILAVSPHVTVWQDEARCEVMGSPFFYQRLDFIGNLIDLGDDTFIVYEGSSSVILRFDKDFNTKFKPIHPVDTKHGNIISRNFFVVEYSLIEELEKKVILQKVPFNQGVHDELLLYFKEKYQ